MAHVWDADLPTDRERATRLIAEQFPALAHFPVEPFGAGFDNAAYQVGPYVFRFVRRRFALDFLEREIRWLPGLARVLPVAISAPTFVGRDEAGHPFAGYPLIEGQTACRARLSEGERAALAPVLGEVLRTLHAQPADDLPGDVIKRADPTHRIEMVQGWIAKLDRRDPALAGQVRALVEATYAAWQGPPERLCFVHGDLYPSHLIVGAAGLVGIIDWGDLHRGDPALDIGLVGAFLPPSAHAAFRAAYGGIDAATWARGRFTAAWHTCVTLEYSLETGNADLHHEGRVALQHLAGG